MQSKVRVRFAPSPTGPLHIGGVRTALYNYLFARQQGGTFILRIEDTDRSRFVSGAEEYINEALLWLGILPEEGTIQGGKYGPYRQSERRDSYLQYAIRLVEEGNAYYAFDAPDELEAMRQRLKDEAGANPVYDAFSRKLMRNSITLPAAEVKALVESGVPWVIRLKVPEAETVTIHDIIRGEVSVDSAHIDDKVLIKSDGMPTYHLANVVDDYLMNISHVIRGEEWLPSAPHHVLLYRFLGWAEDMPRFAHLPLLLKPEGSGKLSKRDAERGGFPIFPLEWIDPGSGKPALGFREEGYLPEATLNFIAMLGWNPGTEQELFSLEELTEQFSLERIVKSGAKFDIEKAKWYNEQYIRRHSDDWLAGEILKSKPEGNISPDQVKALAIAGLMKERISFVKEIWTKADFFFRAPLQYDEGVIAKKLTAEAAGVLSDFSSSLKKALRNLSHSDFSELLNAVLTAHNMPAGKIMQVLRVAVTGSGAGPDLFTTLEVLGKDEVSSRIEQALQRIQPRS